MSFFHPLLGLRRRPYRQGPRVRLLRPAARHPRLSGFWVFHNYSDNYLYVCLALALPFGVVYAAVFGTMSSLFSDSFDPSVRYSAISFVYQFSGIFAAGLTPMVATMLVAWNGGEPWYLCAYLGSAGLISAACTLWIRHLNRKGFPPALPVERETPVSEPLMEGESA